MNNVAQISGIIENLRSNLSLLAKIVNEHSKVLKEIEFKVRSNDSNDERNTIDNIKKEVADIKKNMVNDDIKKDLIDIKKNMLNSEQVRALIPEIKATLTPEEIKSLIISESQIKVIITEILNNMLNTSVNTSVCTAENTSSEIETMLAAATTVSASSEDDIVIKPKKGGRPKKAVK